MGDWRPTRTPQERVERAVRSMVPGSLQGKVAQASPVPHRKRGKSPIPPEAVEDLEYGQLVFEANDVHVITAGEVTADVVVQQLSQQPLSEGLVAFWGPLAQEPTQYTIDYVARTVTWPLNGKAQVGDRLWVHYPYLAGTTLVAGDPEAVVGYSVMHSPNRTGTLNYPANVQDADLLLLLVACNGGVTTPDGWTFLGSCTADDQTMRVYGRAADAETSVALQITGAWLHAMIVAYRGATMSGAAVSVPVEETASKTFPTGEPWNVTCILVGYASPGTTTPAFDGRTDSGVQASMVVAHTTDGSGVAWSRSGAASVSAVQLRLVGTVG